MPIVSTNGELTFVRLSIAPTDIPDLLAAHAKEYPRADEIEAQGAALVHAGFPAANSTEFIQQVCEWGRGHRLVGRVLGENSAQQIADALRDGFEFAYQGHAGQGVERICKLRYLAQSFASKQLRFLAPTQAVILDDVIRSALGYADTVQGYDEFLADCQTILGHAQKAGIKYLGQPLRIANIEAAVFAKLKGF